MRMTARVSAVLAVCVVVALSVACGGGGDDDYLHLMYGEVDFSPAAGGDMTVEVRNVEDGLVTDAEVIGDGFRVYVEDGDYEIVAQSAAGATARMILTGFDWVIDDVGTVDLETTTVSVMTYLALVEPDPDIESLTHVAKLDDRVRWMEAYLETADDVLLGTRAGSDEIALFALGTLEAVRAALAANVDLTDETADTFISMADVGASYDEAVVRLLQDNPGGVVTVGGDTYDDPAAVPADMSSVVTIEDVVAELFR